MESLSMPKRQRKYISIETPEKKIYKTNEAIWYNKVCREKQLEFHPDSAWKRSSKTCMKLTTAECTVENSW